MGASGVIVTTVVMARVLWVFGLPSGDDILEMWAGTSALSALVLVILLGLPVASTICAFLCQPAATAAGTSAHHGDGACAERSQASAAVQLVGVSGHDCRSHTLAEQSLATIAPERVTGPRTASQMPAVLEFANASATLALRPPLGQATPRGTPPLITTPIVLRV